MVRNRGDQPFDNCQRTVKGALRAAAMALLLTK
jgi:hypothetical protein